MAVRVPSHTSPLHTGMASSLGAGAGRVRSSSPARRALAIDMRRIANLLRDPVGATLGGEHSMNTSICSSPHSAWEPGDRGAAPMPGASSASARAASISRMVMQNQFTALAERINLGVTTLQRQCEADRRRIAQLERKLETKLDDRGREGDGRERWAEIQGSVNGLIEETQALARRVEGLDERLWARTSGSELTKQRHRELEQQVQALEQQTRLAAAATEETQKRQATKIRRSEHSLEEVLRRLTKVEDEARQRHGSVPRDGYLEARFNSLEQQQESIDADLRSLQAQLDDFQALRDEAADAVQDGHGLDDHSASIDEVIRTTERSLSSLEKKVTSQIEDVASSLATLRVKVDGQLSRVGTLADRIETAHEPSIEALRGEMAQARLQERRELDNEVTALKARLKEAQEATEDVVNDTKEAMRQLRAELAARTLKPEAGEDNVWMRTVEERLASYEQEFFDLRSRCDELQEVAGVHDDGDGNKLPEGDLEDLRRRLEWLEEQTSGGASEGKSDSRQLSQVQNTVLELREQLSRLKQQASSAETSSASMHQQIQQLQGLIERRQNEETSSVRGFSEVEAKVGAISQQVADISARLLEVEGNMDFAREQEVSMTSVVRSVPPLPLSGQMDRSDRGGSGGTGPAGSLQEKLEAVAEHLEVVDDLSDRVMELERRLGLTAGGSDAPLGLGAASPGPPSEVSFGGDAPIRGSTTSVALEGLTKEFTELQLRVMTSEKDIASQFFTMDAKLERLESDMSSQMAGKLSSFEGDISKKLTAVNDKLDVLKKDLQEQLNERTDHETSKPLDQDESEIVKRLDSFQLELQNMKELPAKVELGLKDISTQKSSLETIQEKIETLTKQVSQTTSAANSAFEDKLKSLDTELKEEVSSISSKLKEVIAGSLSDKDLDDIRDHIRHEVDALKTSFSEVTSKQSSDVVTSKDLDALKTQLKGEVEIVKQQVADAKATTKQDEDMLTHEDVDDLRDFIKNEVESLSKQLKEVAEKNQHRPTREDIENVKKTCSLLDDRLKNTDSTVATLKANIDSTSSSGAISKLEARFEDLEKRLSEPSKGITPTPSQATPEDTNLRVEVQRQVKELTEQLSKELSDLAEHQLDLVSTRVSLEDTSSLKKDLADIAKRLSFAEKTWDSTKQELDAILGPRNKVGISLGGSGSPLSDVRGRLDILFEQVAELQQTRSESSQAASKSEGKAPLLLGEKQVEQERRFSGASCDESLNFSLTEQTERPGVLGEGSLNFSLTEQTRQDMSISESTSRNPRKIAGAGRPAYDDIQEDSDFDEDIELPSAGQSPSGVDGKPSPDASQIKGEAEETTSRPVVGLGSRPRPSEIKTLEEQLASSTSEVNDASESASSKRTPGPKERTPVNLTAQSPGATSSIAESPMGGSGILEASMVSQSCNEVSIGADYSVEDSLELDKCDFVEVVKPSSTGTKRHALGVAGATIAEATAEEEDVSISVSEDEDTNKLSTKPMAKLAGEALVSGLEKEPASFPSAMSKLAGQAFMEGGRQTSGGSTSSNVKPKTGGRQTSGGSTSSNVKPKTAASGDALDSLVRKPKVGLGTDALDSLMSKPKASGDVLDSLLSAGRSSAAKSPEPKTKASPKGRSPGDDDEYGEASFEDNISIAESIQEGSDDASGDAWGSGEAV